MGDISGSWPGSSSHISPLGLGQRGQRFKSNGFLLPASYFLLASTCGSYCSEDEDEFLVPDRGMLKEAWMMLKKHYNLVAHTFQLSKEEQNWWKLSLIFLQIFRRRLSSAASITLAYYLLTRRQKSSPFLSEEQNVEWLTMSEQLPCILGYLTFHRN